jgi:hypothetical protein
VKTAWLAGPLSLRTACQVAPPCSRTCRRRPNAFRLSSGCYGLYKQNRETTGGPESREGTETRPKEAGAGMSSRVPKARYGGQAEQASPPAPGAMLTLA